MGAFGVIVDGLWIAALAIMAGASRQAARRIDSDVAVPVTFDLTGKVAWRLRRNVALSYMPAFACVVWLFLVWLGRTVPAGSSDALLNIGLRVVLAPLFAVVHLIHLKAALHILGLEGQLKS